MFGDDEIAKLRGVIIIPGWVTDIVDEGDESFELRLIILGDNVEDANVLDITGSFIVKFILLRVSFIEDEDEAASDDNSIAVNKIS